MQCELSCTHVSSELVVYIGCLRCDFKGVWVHRKRLPCQCEQAQSRSGCVVWEFATESFAFISELGHHHVMSAGNSGRENGLLLRILEISSCICTMVEEVGNTDWLMYIGGTWCKQPRMY